MTFNIRLLEVIKYSGKNLTNFAKQFKTVTSESIRRFTKHPNSNPTLPFIAEILIVYPEIEPRWLLIGEGEMVKRKADPDMAQEVKSVYGDILSQLRSLEREFGNLEHEVKTLRAENERLRGDQPYSQEPRKRSTG